MSKLCIDLPPIAPDYSGAASALFDLGGIVVMHDASGCTGNYTGFDEPRWLGSKSAVYCSGLRRMDCIMGNDQKYIDGTLEAAKNLNPTMISYLGSPVPMIIGIDMDGMAMETEMACGIPSFGFNTTGQNYYDKGASDVFVKLIKRFAKKPTVKIEELDNERKKKVNILGLLSIDMGSEQNADDICSFIENAGYEINARFAMGLSIEQIERVAEADLNLVISRCGLDAAQYMERKYGIPYVCGTPVGDGEGYLRKLNTVNAAITDGTDISSDLNFVKNMDVKKKSLNTNTQDSELSVSVTSANKSILILHEQILANSIRDEIEKKCDASVKVGSMYGLDSRLAREGDLDLPNELSSRKTINSGEFSVVIADPEIRKILKLDNVTMFELPHVGLSGRLYLDRAVSYLGEGTNELIQNVVSCVTK